MALSKNRPSATSILQRYRRMPPSAQRHIYQSFQSGLSRVEEFGPDFYSKGSGDAEMLFKKLLDAFTPNVTQLRCRVMRDNEELNDVFDVRWWSTKPSERIGSVIEYRERNQRWREATVVEIKANTVILKDHASTRR